MSTPPDHPGGERSPIASTVPSPNESHSAEPAVATNPPSTDTAFDARQKRLRSKAAYRARRSPMRRSARLSANEQENGAANAPTR